MSNVFLVEQTSPMILLLEKEIKHNIKLIVFRFINNENQRKSVHKYDNFLPFKYLKKEKLVLNDQLALVLIQVLTISRSTVWE